MGDQRKVSYTGGINIAMKVPPDQWAATVAFYGDVLGFERVASDSSDPSCICFAFGCNRLWIDRTTGLERAEIWLELTTNDVPNAAVHLASKGVRRRDAVEALPDGFEGFWIENPAAVIHLVARQD